VAAASRSGLGARIATHRLRFRKTRTPQTRARKGPWYYLPVTGGSGPGSVAHANPRPPRRMRSVVDAAARRACMSSGALRVRASTRQARGSYVSPPTVGVMSSAIHRLGSRGGQHTELQRRYDLSGGVIGWSAVRRASVANDPGHQSRGPQPAGRTPNRAPAWPVRTLL